MTATTHTWPEPATTTANNAMAASIKPESALSQAVAAALLDAGCISVMQGEPFRLPSGWASPVYMDCRRIISFPALRKDLVARGIELLSSKGALEGVGSIAGGEASGIALAAWMADELDLPMQYVRKKGMGTGQVEGVLRPAERVLLVDDMAAAGASKARFFNALADAGAQVRDVFVVFDYGCFGTAPALARLGLNLHALADWSDVLAAARNRQSLDEHALQALEAFLHNPSKWSQAHGGVTRSPTQEIST